MWILNIFQLIAEIIHIVLLNLTSISSAVHNFAEYLISRYKKK